MHTHKRKPAYIRQKSPDGNDRAFVKLKGQRVYFGAYDSPESRAAYQRTLMEFEAQRGKHRPAGELSCAELAIRYLRHAARCLGSGFGPGSAGASPSQRLAARGESLLTGMV